MRFPRLLPYSLWALWLSDYPARVTALTLDVQSADSIKDTASKIAYDLMSRYTGNNTGDVPGNLPAPYYWWEAGAMFGEMVNYWYYTGDTTYNAEVLQALQHQRGKANNYEPSNQTASLGNDDQMFWAFAAMSAAELGFEDPPEEDPSWLALAQAVFNRQTSRWDPDTCNGGLRWQMILANVGYDYKNSVTNLGLFQLSARLGRYTGNQTYIDWANKIWDWYEQSSLYDPKEYRIWDGAHTTENCTDASHEQWSYTYGILTAGMAYLYNHTENEVWLTKIDGLLNTTFQTFFPPSMGTKIMVEWTCEPLGVCNNDQKSFKAYLSQWLARTAQLVPARYDTIMPYLRASAVGAAGQCGADGKNCGHTWNTTVPDGTQGVGEQMSALSVVQVMMLDNANLKPPYTTNTGGTSKSDPSAGTDGSDVGGETDTSHISRRPITTGDRVDAGAVTAGVLLFLIGGTTWLVWSG
ncbi:putative glycosyl hydrolase, partial [Aureobasidium melanogenum]